MINIVKKVYKKIHIIQNIFIKNKFLINKKSYAMEGEDLEIVKILKNIKIYGLDISRYAKKNAKKEIKKNIFIGDARKKLKFEDLEFDLAISINTFHNLKLPELSIALTEIERVAKEKFLCVESYRNENEQFNLQCWALTAETLVDTITWRWIFKNFNYSGDFEFIFFN